MASNYLFKGVGVALVTLFDEDGALNAPATADLAASLVDLGVTGVVVAGTTGEASTLTLEERVELLAAVRKVIPSHLGVPVIAGTGAPTTAQAAQFTAAARDGGADALLTLSLPGVEDQRAYYEAIVAAAGDVPVLGYHFPKVSSPGISVDQLGQLPIAGLKDSTGDAPRLLLTLSTWDKPLYAGAPALTTMAAAVGCTGVILGIANVLPEKCVAAWAGDGAAQVSLAQPMAASEARFPASLKDMVAERFGTSAKSRVG